MRPGFLLLHLAGFSILAIALMGCASLHPASQDSSAFKNAHCIRYRYAEFNILACDDRAVGEYCRRGSQYTTADGTRHRDTQLADNGKPVDYYPRACMSDKGFGRRPNVVVGRSHMDCVAHEICHIQYPADPAMCEAKFPCVEDVR